MITITLTGIPSPKKNSQRTVYRNGKMFRIPSQAHEDWYKLAWIELTRQTGKMGTIFPLTVQRMEVRYYVGDLRKRDSTNATQSVEDLLVDAGVIRDDNMKELPDIRMIYKGKVKINPRTEIELFI